MSFVALIREFDSKAANEMEQFWFGKGRDRKAKAEDPELGEISDIEDIAKEPEG